MQIKVKSSSQPQDAAYSITKCAITSEANDIQTSNLAQGRIEHIEGHKSSTFQCSGQWPPFLQFIELQSTRSHHDWQRYVDLV